MQTLLETLKDADRKHIAVGHFNISDLAALRAITGAAREINAPIMIGVSEGERDYVGVREAAALIRALREEGTPIFLNADHTHSLEKAEAVARAGFDEIIFDGSKLPFEENVRVTKEAVARIKSIDSRIMVEGEIGYIGSASAILEETPEGAALSRDAFTTPEEAMQFIKETGIDVLAPAVGNMHGLLKSMVTGNVKKRLDIERIKELKAATGIFMTLHGGSGTADEDFVAAIKAGMTIVHVNTEIRLAWRKGIEEGLAKNPNEVAPYKILPFAEAKIREIVANRLKLFSS